MTRQITCPSPTETAAYNQDFFPFNIRISDTKVLTVLKQPQYPSINPWRIEHATGRGRAGARWIIWEVARMAVAISFAMRVPIGRRLKRGFSCVERTYRVNVPGNEKIKAAVARGLQE